MIINEPHGADVYTNVPKDYVGRNVTPEVFINVLLGNATYLKEKGTGKVSYQQMQKRGTRSIYQCTFLKDKGTGKVSYYYKLLA